MFDRFTDEAKRALSCARKASERLGHEYIGTEHLLLGIVDEGGGVAAKVLEHLNVDGKDIHREVEAIVKPGQTPVTMGQLPFTPRGKRALELSMEEAHALGHHHIGTEHLLLGLIREGEGVAALVLRELDVGADAVRERVVALVGSVEQVSSPGRSAGAAEGLSLHDHRMTCRLVWTRWYDNRRKHSEGSFVHGKRHGQWTFWNEDGSVDEERTGYYEEGKLTGA